MNQHEQQTGVIVGMLSGGIVGVLVGIVLAATTDTISLIGIGPAVGTTLGLSIALARQQRQDDE